MKKERKKIWNIPPEEEQTGLLFWFQLLQKHYFTLCCANGIALASLLPAGYFVYLLIQTKDLIFWVLALFCWVLASPCQTGLQSVCTRLVHRMPVWIKADFGRAWKEDWKASMALGLILGLLWSGLAYSAYQVLLVDGGLSLGYAMFFVLVAYLLTGLTFFGFQQVAMLVLPMGAMVKNAVLLVFAGKLRTFFLVLILWVMVLVPFIYYGLAAYLLLLGWVALGVLTADLMFAPVFSRLFLEEADS